MDAFLAEKLSDAAASLLPRSSLTTSPLPYKHVRVNTPVNAKYFLRIFHFLKNYVSCI
jgi:hypothetical protein